MKGIVWGSTIEIANKQLGEICKEYSIIGTKEIKKITNERGINILFDNGDIWMSLCPVEGVRGTKCNISYIDRQIDAEAISTIIWPSTSGLPFHGISHFGE